jgi:hypothetical protein
MPLYYFHVRDGESFIPDREGVELADLDAARREVQESARELAVQRIRSRQKIDGLTIEVIDESGALVETMHVRDVFH